ncbi:3-hydroxyisobutyrate dehydrogenase [Jimgerdemannia flammicorona]|uniref:3-hydroxyisobutyrate dehydrogenase n=2 Tax=Jimgerdemannia flammicorona TaxID=994334 RepID=A0A433QIF8_9FUNG|nr:3-hydroxyisobutyrate dehydrogenase [Jimgerdemannia flammicorona]RUS29524.1 3-hydroxyisobutyrate dehydrogenase [Jimgerdemannia flammicorona]
MVGAASPADFDTAKPILSRMGKNVIYCGLSGNGQVAKICNNMLLGVSMVAVAETMQLGVRMGMDPKLLANILNTSTGRCWSSDTYNPCPGVIPTAPASREYQGGFGNQLMAKDLRLAVNAAIEAKSTIFMGTLAQQVYNQVSNTDGYERLDFSSVFKVSCWVSPVWLVGVSGVSNFAVWDQVVHGNVIPINRSTN